MRPWDHVPVTTPVTTVAPLRRSAVDLIRTLIQSRTNYRLAYAMDLACPLVLGYLGIRQAPGWLGLVVAAGAGLVTFSFVEYAIHRWLFHAPAGLMASMHQAHHDAPEDHAALPFFTSTGVAALAWWGLAPLVGSALASGFLCGLLTGYFCYGALHHLEHSVRLTSVPFRWLQRRWAVHAVHHRLVDANYGVTTSFWDRVFGTHYQSRRGARRVDPQASA
jgi:sterol desaturase/sphingolipid hydroxylase (fatty acid hydroxylase superfamily)